MNETLIAIVDFGSSKHFFVVPPSHVGAFLEHNSSKRLNRSVTIVFQSAFEYDPVEFQRALDKLPKPDKDENE